MSTAELQERLNRLEALITQIANTAKIEAPYLSLDDMECLLRCKRTFVYELVKDGVLPAPYKLRGKNLWKRSEVLPAIDKALEMNKEV